MASSRTRVKKQADNDAGNLVLYTNGGMVQYTSAMCAIFPGCTAEGKDIFAVVRRKDDQVLTNSPFGDAINA